MQNHSRLNLGDSETYCTITLIRGGYNLGCTQPADQITTTLNTRTRYEIVKEHTGKQNATSLRYVTRHLIGAPPCRCCIRMMKFY